ncbi:alpha-amylase family glycosyl hydrolase [Nitrosococcus wardiae]|uniref:DUF3459 domain-containing protein n=1 Tax=Nitrosococcus wardiae TaxID=1814290 RepID=A0A4P7BVX6_9GAMM|nr:alpha-amylase family glycosyl hydrolase [Nitrosococcus wardiae]QBQ54081.1 DUF3459 domain-containing protein [Nitrosococcus wardiae]
MVRSQDDYLWWQRGIVYQIYPRSFFDADGDGVGDLEGIRQRLDYLEWLGVNGIWISPIYPSPMKDFGYDISDYTAIHPLFGTLRDFERLLAEVHQRGIKLILDFVPNHTSDQHPWFKEACQSRTSAKRDWYLWADPAPGGGPPNNWLSEFGGSAWTWHAPSGQYYYHAFLPGQPDLNWRHPEVRQAMTEVMRFWLDKGVDGFRVDVVWHMIKDEHLRDNPPNPDYDAATHSPYNALIPAYSADQPEVHEVVAEMRKVINAYDERLLIAEVYAPIANLVKYYGLEQSGAQLPFNFHLLSTPWDAAHLREVIDEYEASVPEDEWPNWVLGNHDQPRVASRIGRQQARSAAVLLLTLRGTPTLYYGDELGMENVSMAPEEVMDPRGLNCPGKGLGRDAYRTPMPWTPGRNAGFSEGMPWLPLTKDFQEINVERERADPQSMLSLYRRLIALRQSAPALCVGEYDPIPVTPPLLAYRRYHGESDTFVVALNVSQEYHRFQVPKETGVARLVLSTEEISPGKNRLAEAMTLRPNEAVIIQFCKEAE